VSHLTVSASTPIMRSSVKNRPFGRRDFDGFSVFHLQVRQMWDLRLMTASLQVIASIELVGSASIINTALDRLNLVSRTNR
jgi:hypothetical protein